jgi:hypothetical protein
MDALLNRDLCAHSAWNDPGSAVQPYRVDEARETRFCALHRVREKMLDNRLTPRLSPGRP